MISKKKLRKFTASRGLETWLRILKQKLLSVGNKRHSEIKTVHLRSLLTQLYTVMFLTT